MHPKSPADELAEIQCQIQRLKAREAQLRSAFLSRPDLPRIGRWHRVELVLQSARVFEPRLLPAEIRNDPRYLRDRVTRILRTHSTGAATMPFRSQAAQSARNRSLFGHEPVH